MTKKEIIKQLKAIIAQDKKDRKKSKQEKAEITKEGEEETTNEAV